MKQLQRDTAPVVYCDAKHLATDYQLAKTEVNKAFQKGGFGLWIVRFLVSKAIVRLILVLLDQTP